MQITQTKTDQIPQKILGMLAQELQSSLSLAVRACELAEMSGEASDITSAKLTSESALELINNYALGLRLANLDDCDLELTPLTPGAVMAEIASELEALARNYGVKLDIEVHNQNQLILGNQRALAAALSSAGRCLIEKLSGSEENQLTLKLISRKSRQGLMTGWYWRSDSLAGEAQRLIAAKRLPSTAQSVSSASGLFVADMLLASMNSKLLTDRFRNWSGLAATLEPSRQLSLV